MTACKSTKLDALLRKLKACEDASEWAKTQPDLDVAWQSCERADWLLWFAIAAKADEGTTRLAICACARTALKYVPAGEDRPRLAIETAERYARGEATDAELAAAWEAAREAAWAAAGAAAVEAAWAAAWTTAGAAATENAAVAAARAAAWAAATENAASATAWAAARAAAWAAADVERAAGAAASAAANREMCILVRGHFPHAPEVK